MKNLIVRTLSGGVMLAVLLGCVLGSPWSFGALLLAVVIGGMIEFYALASRCGAEPQRIVGVVTGIVLFVSGFVVYMLLTENFKPGLTLLLFGLPFLLVIFFASFVCELFRGRKNPLANIGTTFGGVIYVALPMTLLPFVSFFAATPHEPWSVLCVIFLIWANDVFAYLVGMTCGRHKLCERISPKKTMEGFAGGVAGAIFVGAVAARCLGMSTTLWIVLAAVAAVTGVAGDLVESMFKRAAGVKDSGNVIPGHGGVLDRFDALLLATPFVLLCIVFYRMLI